MPKTIEQLLTVGTMIEIAATMKNNTDRMTALFDLANDRADRANTQPELDEIKSIDGDQEQLNARYAELKKVEEARAKNEERAKAFAAPINRPKFPNGDNDSKKASRAIAYSAMGNLKHINLYGNRNQDEELAYRFAQWYFATNLPGDSPLRAKAVTFCGDHGIPTVKALNEGINEQGGALVPPEFDNMLIRLLEQFGVFRRYTRMSQMAGDIKMIPRRTGGVTASWVGEAQTITDSTPTYDNVQLVAKKLAARVVMSSEITEDSAISIADQLAFEIGTAMALAEDQAGFLGDGSPTFGGITGIATKLRGLDATIANIAGLFVAIQGDAGGSAANIFSEFGLVSFNNTVALLPQYADTAQTAWYVHRSFYFGVMQRLELAAGGNTIREVASGDRAPRPLFLGYPVNFTQVMPRTDANSQICAILGDLSMGTVMGDRRNRTLFTDPFSLSDKDQIAVRATERVDIIVHDVGNASATAALRQPGSIVALISAAS
jgi:HK97 family phage major capsid protein